MAQGAGQEPGEGRPARNAAPPWMRRNGQPTAACAWHVAPGGVLVVADGDRDGWHFATDDAAGIVHDLAELRPGWSARVPPIPYRDSRGEWHALRAGSKGVFAGFVPIGAASEAEAVAWVLARHG